MCGLVLTSITEKTLWLVKNNRVVLVTAGIFVLFSYPTHVYALAQWADLLRCKVQQSELVSRYGRAMALGSTQPLTQIVPATFPGGKMQPARKADNLVTFICRLFQNLGSFNLL